jgi:hypothetical protein
MRRIRVGPEPRQTAGRPADSSRMDRAIPYKSGRKICLRSRQMIREQGPKLKEPCRYLASLDGKELRAGVI